MRKNAKKIVLMGIEVMESALNRLNLEVFIFLSAYFSSSLSLSLLPRSKAGYLHVRH